MRVCRASSGVVVCARVRFKVSMNVCCFVTRVADNAVCVVVGVTSGKGTVNATGGKRVGVNVGCCVSGRK